MDLNATRVSMYATPPSFEMSVDEFESFAVDRLVVLRMVENLRTKGFKPRELEQQLRPILKERLEPQRKDEASHFTLRLAYSRTEELRRWFVTQETALFRLRLEALPPRALELFLTDQGLIFDSDDGGKHYKIPFVDALDLVARREAHLSNGIVAVPAAKLQSIIVGRFRTALSKSLAKARLFFESATSDPRLAPLLNNVEKHDAAAAADDVPQGSLTLEQLDAAAAKSMPLCMRNTHTALRRDHKLKHWGRMQYGLFLKAAGLSMEDQLRFFETEFTKVMTLDQFNKEHAYNVRHRYGKEGKRVDYTAYGCYKIIMDFAPGPGDAHGCPFKHSSKEDLASLMSDLSVTDRNDVVSLAKSHNYQLACQKHFELTHPASRAADLAVAGVGNHPNAYFKASRKFYQAPSSSSSAPTFIPPTPMAVDAHHLVTPAS